MGWVGLIALVALMAAGPGAAAPADGVAQACRPVTIEGKTGVMSGCLSALAFDTDAFFGWGDRTGLDALMPAGTVDAIFYAGRRGPRWAFAVDYACPGMDRWAGVADDNRCAPGQQRRLLIRVVSWRGPGSPVGWPKSEADMRRFLAASMDWREADLTTCPDAYRTLDSLRHSRFPPLAIAPWEAVRRPADRNGVARVTEIVIPTDWPDEVDLRVNAGSGYVAVHDRGLEGGPGAWARRLLAVVEPCLKSTPAPAPWAASAP